ncbi:hypothetical protein K432DRAFT_376861 [Lepidopterella palustris CBS 459.81]|uniref:Uncharacterized protein n=1 Tax=Lepidopterella palustris CBS 459.81 TaxID=1314670 RepID=A0A8E2JLG3_9PEZI|nr:hypothetical protein K432DRAFT_376861 [Lepidopterella palustris CBS 459.81]
MEGLPPIRSPSPKRSLFPALLPTLEGQSSQASLRRPVFASKSCSVIVGPFLLGAYNPSTDRGNPPTILSQYPNEI